MTIPEDTMNTLYDCTGAEYDIQDQRHSDWKVTIAGVTYRPLAGQEPNAFHRMMQHVAFGFKWERAK